MKLNSFDVWSVLVASLALSGCRPESSESAVGEEFVEVGPKYSAKHGLFVPADTQRSLGLRVVDVAERTVTATVELQLRIYREESDAVFASATVTAEEAGRLFAGQLVHARAHGGELAGRVTEVDGRLLRVTGRAEVLVKLVGNGGTATAGAFLPAKVEIESEAVVVSIPRTALLQCSDGNSVYTVSGESFVRTPVQVGAISGDLVEIREGLYTGDQVVLEPVMSLWMTELAAVKGGQACCIMPAKGK